MEEESSDSEDGDISNFGDDICNMVTGVNMLSNNTTYISGGGRGTFWSSRWKKRKCFGIKAQFFFTLGLTS